MNPGDKVRATLQDTPAGFMTTVTDLTTRQTGFMGCERSQAYREFGAKFR